MEGLSVLFGADRKLPKKCSLHRLFEENAAICTRESGIGVLINGAVISYYELNERSNRAARRLHDVITAQGLHSRTSSRRGVSEELLVAVDIAPSTSLLVAILAIIKLGLAYVPVDASSAINRVRYILHDTKPLCILADVSSVFLIDSSLWSDFLVIDIDRLKIANNNINTVDEAVASQNLSDSETFDANPLLLSIIYTSGSTGTPKGVKIRHRTAINRILWQWEVFPFIDDEVGCMKTSLLFVDSIVEIFSVILKPVSLVVCRRGISSNIEEFLSVLESYRVTRVVLVASLLHSMVTYLNSNTGVPRFALNSLKLWVSNSETLSPSLGQLFFMVFPTNKTLCNYYGSTETMADVTYDVFNSLDDLNKKTYGHNTLSIGRPIFNSSIYIVDDLLQLVPVGETGEICVSGLNVAADGYSNGEHRDSFLTNPFSKVEGHNHDVLYRTGDYGHVTYEGVVVYEGRRDVQVKIGGLRVNVAEVERILSVHPGVDKVVVLCHRLSEITSVIIAYYVVTLKEVATHDLEDDLKSLCCESLPAYMRPRLVRVPHIPLQAHTDKIDRVALRKYYLKTLTADSSHEMETLSDAKRKALNIIALNLFLPPDVIPMHCSFFELGGNSVAMVSTIVQLKDHGLYISIDGFSRAKTIQDTLAQITDVGPSMEACSVVSVGRNSGKYSIRSLSSVPNGERCVKIMAESFARKEPLMVLAGVTEEEITSFASRIYEEASKETLSLVVTEEKSGEIVAGDFLFNLFEINELRNDVMRLHDVMEPIFSLIKLIEEPVNSRLARRNVGRIMYNYCLFVDTHLPAMEQVQICHAIESEVICVAHSRGFAAVVTNNTNPATQDICQHFLDYEVLSSFLVRDFEFNGRKVFGHAQEDFCIKMMMKLITPNCSTPVS